MRIVDQGIVFSGTANTNTANCCFSGLELLSDGVLLATWCAGPEKHAPESKVLMSRSCDGGKSWSQPIEPFCDEFEGTPGSLCVCKCTNLGNRQVLATLMWFDRSDPSLAVFNPKTGGLLPVKVLFSRSSDGGLNWSPLWAMNNEPYGDVCSITGPTLILSDGCWAAQYEVNKPYNDPGQWRQVAGLKISCDEGRTWGEAIEVASDPEGKIKYWDQRHAVAADGTCVATIWTLDGTEEINFSITESHDNARTWSKPRDTGLAGQAPYPIFLADGRMAVIYIDRYNSQTIRVRLSHDNGKTFENTDAVIYKHQATKIDLGSVAKDTAEHLQQQFLWTFGFASGVASPDGDLWVSYYGGDTESTNIYWARLRFDD